MSLNVFFLSCFFNSEAEKRETEVFLIFEHFRNKKFISIRLKFRIYSAFNEENSPKLTALNAKYR